MQTSIPSFGDCETKPALQSLHTCFATPCSPPLQSRVGHRNSCRSELGMHLFSKPTKPMCIPHQKRCEPRGRRLKKPSVSLPFKRKRGSHENTLFSIG